MKLSNNWGIWNDVTKRFVFGISEPTANDALFKFRNKIPKSTYYKCRYQTRRIPEGWVNPPNESILIRRSNK